MSGWSSGEKLAVVGAGTVVVLSITVLAATCQLAG